MHDGIAAQAHFDFADLAHPARPVEDDDIGEMLALAACNAVAADGYIGQGHVVGGPCRLAGKRKARAGDELHNAVMQVVCHWRSLPFREFVAAKSLRAITATRELPDRGPLAGSCRTRGCV